MMLQLWFIFAVLAILLLIGVANEFEKIYHDAEAQFSAETKAMMRREKDE